MNQDYYKDEEIVKIEREQDKRLIEKRENDIIKLIKKYSLLNDEDIERFDCVVLTEIFNNVTEHGISNYDNEYKRRSN